jgi:hypothetical protein
MAMARRKAVKNVEQKAGGATGKTDDWFAALETELSKKTNEIERNVDAQQSRKYELNKTLVSDFWKILLRFEQVGIHFAIEPPYEKFAKFEKYPFEWTLKDNYNFGELNQILVTDRTQDQGRVGDTLKARYYVEDGVSRVRFTFEYCEGEHYYKYSGWKRIFGQYILDDATVEGVDIDSIHDIFAGLVKVWYESHLRKNRQLLLDYLKATFKPGESYAL